MLYVHRSNRVEKLVTALGDVIEADPPGPFDAEPIVVQGRGMERWLSMELARRFGVWAHPSFPFPRRFLLDLFGRVDAAADPGAGALSAFEPESLSWAIAARLPGLLSRRELAGLREYLRADDSDARLLSLARRIAKTFDDYVVFRSDLIAAWEKGAGRGWEPVLWRQLVEDLGRDHVAARAAELMDRLTAGGVTALPRRLSLFGVSTLAPMYLDIFARLGDGARDVHLFVLSPTDQYWAHLRDRRSVVRETWRDGRAEGVVLEELLEREVGNRLLASLGRLGREFQAVLEGAVDYVDGAGSVFEDPVVDARPSALAALQSDMLALRYGGERSAGQLDPDDASIAVHSCHNPMREVQVLHDQLLGMFASDRSLRPRDVIVMTPDVDAYAPFVEAVFEADGSASIPFRIADRGPTATNEVFEAFAELLRVLPGRVTSADVIDLLRRDVVRRRFGFDDADIELAREWVDRSEIRWGIDHEHRAAHGHPDVDQNTWQFGLRRLFLGYATGGEEEDGAPGRVAAYAPYDDIEGSDAAVLGRLAELCQRLFAAARRHREALPVAAWPGEVERLLGDLFWQEGVFAFQAQALRAAAHEIAARAERAGYTGAVDLVTIAQLLEEELRRRSVAHGFLSGELTFCELVPMRTIPFRVVCLIGMNDGAFPRVERRPDFDLMASSHRWGDRSVRDDDRYMFLEALLSARDRLYVSYVGQDAQTSTDLPPSVVVQELLDVLDDTFAGYDARARIVNHPMQAFSPKYFAAPAEGGAGLPRSYSTPAYRGAAALVGERRPAPPFVGSRLPWSPEGPVALRDFVRFFEHPARAFLQKRMRLYLGGDADVLETREPLDLDDLQRWDLGDRLLRRTLAGQSCDVDVVARFGVLPVGSLGGAVHDTVLRTVRRIAASAPPPTAGAEPVDVDLDLGPLRVSGVLDAVHDGVRQIHTYSKIGGRHELGLWINHLLLCAAVPEAAVESRLCGRKDARGAAMVRLSRVAEPLAPLATLAELYVEGMQFPLPLFDGASREYAERRRAGKSDERECLRAAEKRYDSAVKQFPNPYLSQLYGSSSPFADASLARRFAEIAVAVFDPFLEARREEGL